MRGVAAVGLAVGLAFSLVGTAVVASAVSLLGIGDDTPAATSAATARIPPTMLVLYQEAAATCPGLPWTILAAIGTVESDNGQSNLPGVHNGANAAGAEGPMQFEPATFRQGHPSRTTLTWTKLTSPAPLRSAPRRQHGRHPASGRAPRTRGTDPRAPS